MFGFKKHCKVCGIDLEKNQEIRRFGKSFCTDEHANDYLKFKQRQQKEDSSRSGGCC